MRKRELLKTVLSRKALIGLLALSHLMIYATAALAQSTTQLSSLTQAQWRSDLAYLAQQIPKIHKNAFHSMKPEAFQEAVATLDARILKLNTDETLVEFSRILAMVQDDHSGYIDPLVWSSKTNYPLKLMRDRTGIYVRGAPKEYASLLGARVVRIGSEPIERALDQLAEIFPHDEGNLGHVDVAGVPLYLTQARVLHGLHLTPTASEATYVFEKSGKQFAVTLRPTTAGEVLWRRKAPSDWVDIMDETKGTLPPWMKHHDKNFWFDYLNDLHLIYVQFNEVSNEDNQSIADFFGSVFEFIDTHDVQKLVLDLRNNLGGDNTKLRPVIVGIIQAKKIDIRGRLFVLIGPSTHSAAQSLVNRLENYTEAIFVGAPSGQNVNFYSDTSDIVLPNSGLAIGMSHLYWQDKEPWDKRTATAPEIAAEVTFADYLSQRDPAMQQILTANLQSLDEAIAAALPNGYEVTLAACRSWAANPIHRYVSNVEDGLSGIGYSYLRRTHLSEAVIVFRVGTDMYPRSWNTWRELGNAYVRAGEKPGAIAAYERALQLNPESKSVASALKTLRSQ